MFIVLLELPSLRVRRRLPAVFMLYLEFMPVQWHFTVAWPPIAATQVLSARYILLPPYAWTTPTVAQHANEPYSSGSSFLWGCWGWNYSITSSLVLPLQSDLFLNPLLQFLSDSFFFNFSILFVFLLLSISIWFSVFPDFLLLSLLLALQPKRLCWITTYDLDTWASFPVSVRGVIPSLPCQASYPMDPGGCLTGLNRPVLQSTGSRVRPKTASQEEGYNDRRIFITAPQGWERAVWASELGRSIWYNILSTVGFVASGVEKSFPFIRQSFSKVCKLCMK